MWHIIARPMAPAFRICLLEIGIFVDSFQDEIINILMIHCILFPTSAFQMLIRKIYFHIIRFDLMFTGETM